MSIICVGGIKGGVGKTTLAVNLAVIRSANSDVLLIDGDDQYSATDFSSIRTETKSKAGYTFIQLMGSAIRTQGLILSEKYKDIIIDVGGRDTASQRAALIIADIALIPFNPRSLDIWTIGKVVNLVEECRAVNPKLVVFTFLTKADAVGSDNQEAAEALKEIKDLTYLDTPIGARKTFANAASNGLSVIEHKPYDKKAIDEIMTLYRRTYDVQKTSN